MSQRVLLLPNRPCANVLGVFEAGEIMSIVNCSECDGKVSTLAASCPHCGAPVSSSDAMPAAMTTEITSNSLSSSDELPINSLGNVVESVPLPTVNPASVKSVSAFDSASLPPTQQPVEVAHVANGRIVSKNSLLKFTSIACFAIGFAIMIYGYSQSSPHTPGSHPNSGLSWWVLVGGLICAYGFNTWGGKK